MPQQSLEQFIALSSQIRLYSAPSIESIKNEGEYLSTLVRNFTKIGVLSEELNQTLDNYVYPLLETGRPLSDEETEALLSFSRGLVDMYSVSTLEPMICYLISCKLVEDADYKQDEINRISHHLRRIIIEHKILWSWVLDLNRICGVL